MTMNEELENKIQALVDGELSSQARKEFLLDLENSHPELWRTVALGFVEGQLLQDALIDRQSDKKAPAVFPSFLRIAATLTIGALLGGFFTQQLRPPAPKEIASAIPTTQSTDDDGVVEIARSRIDRISEAVSEQGFNPVIERTLIQADLGEGRRLIIPLNRLLVASGD